jgi:uncharacterized protein YdaU (DUF1376 family)
MHYYQHHIGDFIRDTAHLNDHQMATYLRLIWSYYDTEKPISGELEDIAFAVRSDEKTVGLLLRHYFKPSADGWIHTRCDKVIDEYKARGEKARKKAKARWNDAAAMPQHSHSNAAASKTDANHKPITNNQDKEEREDARASGDCADDAKDDAAGAATPSRRAVSIPDEFPGETEIAWCESERPELSAGSVAIQFRDYHLAHGSTMKSWPAAWRTWVRKERPPARAAPTLMFKTAADKQAEAIFKITGGLAGKPPIEEVIDVEPFRQRQLAGR